MYFTLVEYQARLERARAVMHARQLDVLLLFGQEAVNYLSGFYSHGHFAGIVLGIPAHGEPFLILRQMEKVAAQETTWVQSRYVYNDHEHALDYTAKALADRALLNARIAADTHSWYLTADRYMRLLELLPHATLEPTGDFLDYMRTVKSEAELVKVRRAGQSVTAAMTAALQATRVGVSENDIAAEMAAARIRSGGGLPIDGVVTTGPRTLQGHGPWTERVVQADDPFYYEVHGICDHYWTRSIRSGVVGMPTDRQRDTFDLMLEAQDLAVNAIKPGASAREVDRLCRDRLIEGGLYKRDTFTRRTGYGMGLMFRPTPGDLFFEFTRAADFELQEGMVFMMLCLAEGLGIGDTLEVTASGAEFVTKVPRCFHTGG